MSPHTFRTYITSILATLLLTSSHITSRVSGSVMLNSDAVKGQPDTLGSRGAGEQAVGEASCGSNGRSPIVCGMCAEIFHQGELEEQRKDGGVNMAAECCGSETVYQNCMKTLKDLMEEREAELYEQEQEDWNDQQGDEDMSSMSDNPVMYYHNDVTDDDVISDDVMQSLESAEKRRMNPFLGKRANPFLGKRANPFLGKRANPFLGKRRMNPFLGKRAMNPFLGKRAMNPFLGKRAMNPFLGKRAMNPFLGKRRMNPFLGKRGPNPFLGKRAMNPFLGKRANPFLG